MMLVFIFLVFLLFCVSTLAVKFYFKSKSAAEPNKDLQPFDAGLVLSGAAVFAGVICFLFFIGISNEFDLSGNMGQAGDFIGGLTNPILSFVALMVLLRTTMIQTNEAKKSTSFMERQSEFLEKQETFLVREKFENTFFQILNRLENYCEVNFRRDSDVKGVTVGAKIVRELRSKKKEFDALSGINQYRQTQAFVSKKLDTDLCIGLVNRAMRALRLINNADISDGLKTSFAGLLLDSMHPDERIILCSSTFFQSKSRRVLLRKWGFPHVREHVHACFFIHKFYKRELGSLPRKKKS